MRKRISVKERLWKKIVVAGPNDCWLWTGGKVKKGYGTIRIYKDDKAVTGYAHREVLKEVKGLPPSADSHALHSCDNPCCCNPAHLSWGSNSKNRKEAKAKAFTPTEGFFFGANTAFDDDDRQTVLDFVAKSRAAIANGYAVFYDSWW